MVIGLRGFVGKRVIGLQENRQKKKIISIKIKILNNLRSRVDDKKVQSFIHRSTFIEEKNLRSSLRHKERMELNVPCRSVTATAVLIAN